jgi:hypothetical protein
MTPEHLALIDAIMTLPETSLDKEMQRRIAAINAVIVYCGIEVQISYRGRRPGRPSISMTIKTENSIQSESDSALRQAILSVRTDKRPQICFLCVGNPALSMRERVKQYATAGSLSRHFRRHITKLPTGKQIDYQICNIRGMHQVLLQNHAERFHGTIIRVRT